MKDGQTHQLIRQAGPAVTMAPPRQRGLTVTTSGSRRLPSDPEALSTHPELADINPL